MYAIELKAGGVNVRVEVDESQWPQKRAAARAREALTALSRFVAVAMEQAPHVGVARELVEVSPVSWSGKSLGRLIREIAAPERETAPQVGGRTQEAVENAVLGTKLPRGVRLVRNSEGDPQSRVSPSGGKILYFLVEDRHHREGARVPMGSLSVDLEMDAEEIKARVLETARALLKQIKRDKAAAKGKS
jgi:hypothetical protein